MNINYKKISRNYTDYIDMIIDIIKQENLKDKNEIFDVCDNVLKLFKVSKAEYFTNPEAIPDLKLEWKCYDVWCGVGFWSKRQNKINNIDIIVNKDIKNGKFRRNENIYKSIEFYIIMYKYKSSAFYDKMGEFCYYKRIYTK